LALARGVRFGPYELTDRIGAGGMGEVWRAMDTALGRQVAVKVLLDPFRDEGSSPDLDPARARWRSERLARFEREARTLASLNHPGIATVYGLETCDGVPALVMEFVEGLTLADRIASGPIPLDVALPIARQVAEALEAAHEHGIVHRDLKPANVMVRPDGTVKVLDFGLAKALDPGEPALDPSRSPTITSPAMTKGGVILGTAAYMAPEQAKGRLVDKRADVWALGCLLYEMLTGRRAFVGEGPAETIAAVLTHEPDWTRLPGGMPPVVRMFMRRALEKDPAKRVRDVGDLRLALDGAFDATTDDRDPALSGRPRLRALGTWVAAALLAAVSTGFLVWTMSADRERRTVSFYIDPPEGSEFSPATMLPRPALSPDGRQLAFIARLGATQAIWVQTLGDVRARPLRGTEGAEFPFWSPDGRSIAFRGARPLSKIAASGDGAPQELCACGAEYGGSWGTDGTIVFADADGVFRVSADGGAPVRVAAVDPSRGEFSLRYPVLLPDGRRFLYLIRSTREEHRGLFLGSLDDPTLKRRLVPDDSNGAIGVDRNGRPYLFFVRDLTLLAQPFDLASGAVSGEPVVVARPVIPGENGRFAPFAVNGHALVYRQNTEARSELLWVDRRGAPGAAIGVATGTFRHPALSPDGTRIALSQLDPSTGKRDLWVVDVGRQTRERVTRDPVTASFPLWSSGGQAIVFASAGAGPWNIYERSADGSGADRTVYEAPSPSLKYPSDITRDGRTLLFQGIGDVWALDLGARSEPVRVVQGEYGRVSPNQRWLAYTSLPRGEREEAYVTEFPQARERLRISRAGGTDPQWSRDGRELYYIDGDSMLTAVAVRTDTAFEFAAPVPLFRITSSPLVAPGSRYAVAPDGQRFLVVNDLTAEQRRLAVTIDWTLDAFAPRTGS
jgi:serine/threonine protein kinase/Tol biopolymer transport system component